MKPYSIDLRKRVLSALDKGMSRTEAIKTFEVSESSIKRWVRIQKSTGDVLPKRATGGRQAKIGPEHADELRAQVAVHSDATLQEHADLWNESHGTSLSRGTLFNALRKLGITLKKNK